MQFHRAICQLPIGIISVGTILHPFIVSDAKLPFVGPLRDGILRNIANRIDDLIARAQIVIIIEFNYRIRTQYA